MAEMIKPTKFYVIDELGKYVDLATAYPNRASENYYVLDEYGRKTNINKATDPTTVYVDDEFSGRYKLSEAFELAGITPGGEVHIAVRSVVLNMTTVSVQEEGTVTLTATVIPSNATNKNITWSVDNGNVTVTDGVVTAVTMGKSVVTVTTEDGGKTASCVINITAKPVAVTGITVNTESTEFEVGQTTTVTATVEPENATNKTVTWSSSDEAVATVNNRGVVTGKGVGTVTITATTVDGGFTASCDLNIKKATVHVTSVSLDKSSEVLEVGNTLQLTATVNPDDADNKNVTWSSSNDTIATVSESGFVTAVGTGDVTIIVTTEDGGHKADCVIGIIVKVTGISLDTTSKTIQGNGAETFVLTATVTPDNATDKSITWSSSNTDVATVDSNGQVTGVNAGDVTITATTVDGGFTATCDVIVEVHVSSVTLNKSSSSMKIGVIEALRATVEPDNATDKSVTWSSDNEAVATVSDGVVTAIGAGTANITVTTSDGGKTASCTFTVADTIVATGITLDKTEVSIAKGETATLTATVEPENAEDKSVIWSSSNEGIATVAAGVVTAVAEGTVEITVTDIQGHSATCAVTVTADPSKVQTISLSLNETTLTLPETKTEHMPTAQLTVTVSPETATNKAVTWSSSNTAVATVDQTGLVTAQWLTEADDTTITVTSAADPSKTASCTVTVKVYGDTDYNEDDVDDKMGGKPDPDD